MLTNQITKTFFEPRLLILTDPRMDFNALKESSYVNIPIIALCNSDNNLAYVDCAIPCNNRSKKSLAMIYWLLTREVLTLKGLLKEGEQLEEMVDMFLYRDVDKKQENVSQNYNLQEADVEEVQEVQNYVEPAEGEDEGEENFIGGN